MTMEKRNRILVGLLIAAAILLLVCFAPLKRHITQEFQCTVLDQEEEGYSGQATVIFTGTYSDYLFRKDSFKGRIDIDGYELLYEMAAPLTLSVGEYQMNHIRNYDLIRHDLEFPGTVFLCEDLESFFLWLNAPMEENPSASRSRYFLCYPEMTLEEIYAILDGEG